MKSIFNAFAGPEAVCVVMDPARARATAEAMLVVDLTGSDADAIRNLRAAADEADRLAREYAARQATKTDRRALRVVEGTDQ